MHMANLVMRVCLQAAAAAFLTGCVGTVEDTAPWGAETPSRPSGTPTPNGARPSGTGGANPLGPALPSAPGGKSGDPGRVVAHRLNRVEYDNTVRDLFFGLDLRPSAAF